MPPRAVTISATLTLLLVSRRVTLAPPLLGGRLGPEFIIFATFFVFAALPFFDPTLLSLLSNLRLLFNYFTRNEVALPLHPSVQPSL